MIRSLVRGLVDIVYPKTCIICKIKLSADAVDGIACPGCWAKIRKNTPPFCRICGKKLEKKSFSKHVCPGCSRSNLKFDRAFAPCVYDGVLKDLIHEFKYNYKDYLARPLSKLMSEHINYYDLPMRYIDYIVPVPLHKSRLREREFNQAALLARHIADDLNITALEGLLKRHRPTRAQVDLERSDRLENVKGSFCVEPKHDLRGKNILLIDDVLTTGATSSEAASALKAAGAGIVFVLTLAN